MHVNFLTDENKEYEDLFTSHGYKSRFIPLFTTKYKDLGDIFSKPPRFTSVIVTSKRSFHLISELHPEWREINWFCVGRQTAKKLMERLGIEAKGKCNSSAELVEYIKSSHATELASECRILFLVGDKTLGTIPENLPNVHSLQTYETVLLDREVLRNRLGGVSSAVFFSPSGVSAVAGAVGPEQMQQMQCIAIGAATHQKLAEHGVCARVCAAPTPDEVFAVVSTQSQM